MSEVQKPGADASMTASISTKKDLDVSISNPRRFLKKAFLISGKSIVVIHQDIVDRLGINECTWFEEEITENGILLRISCWSEECEVRG
jgi:hypothetical protein